VRVSLFKNHNFLYLWSSQILSQFTINIMTFLVLIRTYEQTGSTIAASFIWIAYGIPALLIGPIAAAFVDIVDRRKILMVANIAQAFVVLIYALLYQRFLYLSYGVVLGYSLLDQFYVPAEAATLPSVVRKKNLAQANGLFFISQQTATILGFGLAGLISEVIGFGKAMSIGTVLLFLAFLIVSRLPSQKWGGLKRTVSFEGKIYRFFGKIKEGYVFIRHKKTIFYPFFFLMWLHVSLSILVVNMPEIGATVIRTKPSLAGAFILAPGGLGALAGTFTVSRLLAREFRKKKIIDTALLMLSLAFMTVALVVPSIEFWAGRLVLIFIFFMVGFSYVSALIPALTFLQMRTPKKLMGRIFGNFWFLTMAVTLLPVLFSATVTEVLGIRPLLFLIGAIAGLILIVSKFYVGKNFTFIEEA